MEKIKQHCIESFKTQPGDALALGIIDFEKKEFKSFQIEKNKHQVIESSEKIFFDLASLTKPLTNSCGAFSNPEKLNTDMSLLLNHKSSLPAWGLLGKTTWKEQLLSYEIKKAETEYSDFGALRFMLEFNKTGETLHKVAKKIWDEEVVFWTDLTVDHRTVQNGFVNGRPNFLNVHDPNAFNIKAETSHAGLFGTVEGVCKTLLNFDQNLDLLNKMNNELSNEHDRFVLGWDTVSDAQNPLAGNGCGERVFGHLGFTGTSIWIDPVKKLGHVLLSNTTKLNWYDKQELNKLRKSLGRFIWEGSPL
ncbi:MAG: hypothetical protein CME64_14750 [Halobacteriovoraceae bacterium]|nr:hypothetical protein [Halobacteriovoraceae bacterium]